jgi:hypothetical protein
MFVMQSSYEAFARWITGQENREKKLLASRVPVASAIRQTADAGRRTVGALVRS